MRIKNRYIKYLIIAWVLFYAIPSSASVAFYHYGIENGLPEARIISISQDANGFIWMAGENRLFRFDGQQFKAYQNTGNDFSVIPGSKITTLFTASDGTLWVGSENGISWYNFYKDKFIGPVEGWKSVHVNDFAEDNEKNLWIATDEGLARFNPKQSKTTWYTGSDTIKIPENAVLPVSNINATACQPDGKIWFSGSYGGLYRLDPQTLEVENFNNFGGTNFGSFDIAHLQFANNQIFASTITNGFFWFNPEENKVNHQHFDHLGYTIKNFQIIDDSIVWLSSNNGLIRFNIQAGQFDLYTNIPSDPMSIDRTAVDNIYIDNDRNLWVSSGIRGVNLGLTNVPFYHFVASSGGAYQLTQKEVTSILFDHNNNMWLGYEGGFVEKHSHTPVQMKQFQLKSQKSSGPPGSVMTIFEDSRQRIWVGSWQGGLQVFNPVRLAFEHVNFKPDSLNRQLETADIRGITEDNDGNIWISFHGTGIGKYNPESKYLKLFRHDPENPFTSLSNDYSYNLCTDHDNNLWIATVYGVTRLNLKTEQFSTYFHEPENPASLSDNTINIVHCDVAGNIWAGTGNGLNIFRPEQNTFLSVLTDDDFPFLDISAIESVSPGEIWCSTQSGILRLNYDWISGNDSISFQTRFFNYSDGLVSTNYFARSSATDGENNIYFGGNEGIDFFNPYEVKDLQRPPGKNLITEISVDGNPYFSRIDTTSPEIPLLKLSHDKRMINIRFTTIDFSYQARQSYRYMLENFNTDWIYSQNEQVATYTNLSPGNYFFRIEVMDKNGKWQSQPALFQLKIKAPFWRTPLFIILMVVFIVLLFVFILKWRSRVLIKRQKKLEQIIDENISELQQKNEQLEQANQTKNKFFSIISHDLRSPFSGLVGILDVLTDPDYNMNNDKHKELLQAAKKSADNTFELLDNLLTWARSQMEKINISPQTENLSKILQNNIELKEASALQKGITINRDFPENTEAFFDADMINTVARNLLSNALKYTPPEGEITVSAESKNGVVTVHIADTGIGMNEEEMRQLFNLNKKSRNGTQGEKGTGLGLIICKEFIERNSGKIWVTPNQPKGTVFHFSLPEQKI
jgi:signal transduction histidine kinase/ligand-binding sensor domain-containing protein